MDLTLRRPITTWQTLRRPIGGTAFLQLWPAFVGGGGGGCIHLSNRYQSKKIS
jgi:hypothetical protein